MVRRRYVRTGRPSSRCARFETASSASVRIADRDTPIARVVPYAATSDRLVVRELLHAYGSLGDIPLPPPARLRVDAVKLLLDDRRTR